MKRKICMFLLVTMMAMSCGCNSEVPDLTEEQTALITEYATNLLVKHSELSQRNLLNEAELQQGIIEEEEARLRKIREDEIAQTYLKSEVKPVDGSMSEDEESALKAASIPTKTISEFLEMNDFVINYSSCELCDSYPDVESEEYYMAMDATDGNQLCVVKFQVQNITSSDREFDMLSRNARFLLHTDEGETIYSQATMLLDDLSSYRGNVAGNTTEQMVLIFEVKDEITQIESAELLIKTKDGENVVLLN